VKVTADDKSNGGRHGIRKEGRLTESVSCSVFIAHKTQEMPEKQGRGTCTAHSFALALAVAKSVVS
jgi:hypothetical protein